MARGFRTKYVLAALAAVIIVALLIKQTGWSRKNLTWPEIAIREGVAPIQKSFAAAKIGVGGFFAYFSSLKELRGENLRLREQIDKFNIDVQKVKEYKLENHRLHIMLNLKESMADSYKLVSANVIARDVSNWTHTIVIDIGSNDGVKADMAVISKEGLVGRVWAVTPNTAEVRLIVDRDSAVGGMIQDTRLPGIVDGNGENSALEFVHIPNDVFIEPNQTVTTSGLESLFPKGLRIGYISEIYPEPNGLTKRAVVIPFVDFHRLEEVMVILQVRRGQ